MGVRGLGTVSACLPRTVSRRLGLYRLQVQIRRQGSRTLSDLPALIEKGMDPGKMRNLRHEVGDEYERDPASAAKYAIPRHWLLLNTLRAANLGLHNKTGLRILDIGCGPAYFLAVSRALGHQAEGVDAPDSHLRPVERQVYRGLIDVLQCGPYVRPLLIEPFVPLPDRELQYDLITAFWVCFNRHRQPDEWTVKEWQYFVDDAMGRLRSGGRLFLDLNENPERYGALRFYDEPTLRYFRSVGSVDRGQVLVTRE
jgi:SAM-dependent methyltransferase